MGTSRIPYFSFYPADFMNGVRGMTPQEIGVYTMLLCRIYEENGPVEMNAMRLSTYCGMREKTFVGVLEKLIALGKFTVADGHLSNQRAEVEIHKRSDSLKIASRAGKVSAEKRQQKQCESSTDVQRTFNHTDTDTEEKEEANASSKKRGSRLPAGWRLPSAWGVWAMEQGLSEVCVRREAEKFSDYWVSVPGQKGVKLDWEATWRNWVRKAVSDRSRSTSRIGGNSGAPQIGDRREVNGVMKEYAGVGPGWIICYG